MLSIKNCVGEADVAMASVVEPLTELLKVSMVIEAELMDPDTAWATPVELITTAISANILQRARIIFLSVIAFIRYLQIDKNKDFKIMQHICQKLQARSPPNFNALGTIFHYDLIKCKVFRH